jgi:hypothetical protein
MNLGCQQSGRGREAQFSGKCADVEDGEFHISRFPENIGQISGDRVIGSDPPSSSTKSISV